MKVILSKACPVCGSNVIMTSHGYQCTGCNLTFPLFEANRYITKGEAEAILSKKPFFADGFSNERNVVFSAIPIIKDGRIFLKLTIAPCPYGKEGMIRVSSHSFLCDKYGSCGVNCHLKPRRCYNAHLLTIEEMLEFLETGSVTFNGIGDDGEVAEFRLINNFRKHKQQLIKPKKQ